MQTITSLFDSYDDAAMAVKHLRAAGVPEADFSLVATGKDARTHVPDDSSDSTAAGTGASLGALLAGSAGLLAGLGLMAIPGIGPVVAAGWLASTAAGVAAGGVAGGLLGSLVSAGVDHADAEVYAEGVKRGGTLVTARVDDPMAAEVHDILDRTRRVNLADRRSEYQQQGWNGFDETVSTGLANPPLNDPYSQSGARR